MIKQIYTIRNEVFSIIIKGREVYYKDRKMPEETRMIPMDNKVKRKILLSRNKIDPKLIDQFKLTKEEQVEYDNAVKNNEDMEERLAEICKKDCKVNGAILQKEER